MPVVYNPGGIVPSGIYHKTVATNLEYFCLRVPGCRALLCAAEAAACGELNGNCCPPEDPDAPPTSAGPEYTCNSPELFCRSRVVATTSSVPPNILREHICLVSPSCRCAAWLGNRTEFFRVDTLKI